jgi:two-component system chemotaxis response regulator CheB
MVSSPPDIESVIEQNIKEQQSDGRSGQVAVLTCPDCGGSLWQADTGPVPTFTCHTGHRWTADSLLFQKTEQLEAALFEAYRLLKEKSIMLRQAAQRGRRLSFRPDLGAIHCRDL